MDTQILEHRPRICHCIVVPRRYGRPLAFTFFLLCSLRIYQVEFTVEPRSKMALGHLVQEIRQLSHCCTLLQSVGPFCGQQVSSDILLLEFPLQYHSGPTSSVSSYISLSISSCLKWILNGPLNPEQTLRPFHGAIHNKLFKQFRCNDSMFQPNSINSCNHKIMFIGGVFSQPD